jgi:prolyl 4-hydroxylase
LPRSDVPKHVWRTPAERQLVSSVEERIAHATGVPLAHGEPSQVLRYGRGQQYTLHPDFFDPKDDKQLANGGNRQATMLIYLNTLDEADGGATHFPKGDLRVQPRSGDAILWHNLRCDGRVDPDSTHAGEPVVTSTTKWVLSKWLRQRPFEVDVGSFELEPGRGRSRRRDGRRSRLL